MTDQTRIIEKIRKCLALAQDSRGNAAEAENALRQAQALMAKHGIDMGDVAASEIGNSMLRSKVSVVNPMLWEWHLMKKVCSAFGCVAFFYAGGPDPTIKGSFRIVGPKGYIEIAQYACEVLMRQIVKARTDYVKGLGDEFTRGEKSKMANSFCLAWVGAVASKISAFADPEGKNAEAIKLYCEKKLNISKEPAKRKGDERIRSAMRDGWKAAENVRLNHAMNGADETLRLG